MEGKTIEKKVHNQTGFRIRDDRLATIIWILKGFCILKNFRIFLLSILQPADLQGKTCILAKKVEIWDRKSFL